MPEALTERDVFKIKLSLKAAEAADSRRTRYGFPTPSVSSPH